MNLQKRHSLTKPTQLATQCRASMSFVAVLLFAMGSFASAQSAVTETQGRDSSQAQGGIVSGAQTSVDQTLEAAAKDAAQNPVSPAISLPFQNNTLYGVGPYRRAENAFIVEPVIPFRLSTNWAVVTRTIVPVEVVPRLSPALGVDYGLGNIQPQFYFTPTHPGKIFWGAGGQLWLPTATDSTLGINKWGGGPAFAGVLHKGHWLGGALLSNQFAGTKNHHVNELTANPFVFFNMERGWYLISSSVITSDWTAPRSNRWTVPLGGGFGRVFKVGDQAMNARTQLQNDVRTTSGGPTWQLQLQLQFVFLPKKKTTH